MFFLSLVLSVVAFAQDKKVDITIGTEKKDSFFGQPWVWVVGAVVLLLIILALMRGNTTTTTRDTIITTKESD